MDELRVVVSEEAPDVVAICETWTNDSIGDPILRLEGYVIAARKDRNDTAGGRGGGLLVYVRKEMAAWEVDVATNFNQCVTVTVKCGGSDLKIHSIYRSPNSSRDNDQMLNEWISTMEGVNVIIGDLNHPDVDWETGMSGSRGRDFLEATLERGFEQLVSEPTHISGNVLDLILCDSEGLVNMVRTIGRLGKSDHEMISFRVTMEAKKAKKQQASLNYLRANYQEMRNMMKSESWEEMEVMDVNEKWIYVKKKILESIEKHTPRRKSSKRMGPPWMNKDLKKCINEKRKAWKKWKESGKEGDRLAYRDKERETKTKIRKRKNGWEKQIVEKRNTNPRLFYQQINRARKSRDKVAPLYDDDGEVTVDPKRQAEILNRFYAGVFTRNGDATDAPEIVTEVRLEKISITKEKVIEAINGLKQDAAPGPDEIPPRVFHELKEELAEPLTKLFESSMETGRIPDEWRDATVTPIYKQKGSRSDPGNYRPVSLTNVAGKLLERIVKNEITAHIESNNLMSNSQHGFRAGRSVQTNLIEFLNKTTKWLDEGRSFDVIYLDFAKAFDKVCHRRLMVKLKKYGIFGEVLRWIGDWLSGRRQRVKVEGEYSAWEDVISSVLQGSVLGGLLFIIFIDDIDETVEDEDPLQTALVKFADDTKVARIVENEEDVAKMQETISNLAKWAKKWAMLFNAKKCKIMHFGNRNPRANYLMDGIELGKTTEERDLGIQIVDTLKPTRQCAIAAKSAHFAISQIQRSFHFRKKSDLIPLYKTFVRPKLEFGVAAWSPWNESDIQVLENVQKRLIRLLSDVRGASYEEKVQDAGLSILKERRERGDMIEVFKTLRHKNNVDAKLWFSIVGEEARPLRSNTLVGEEGERRRENVLEVERCNLEVRKNFFVVRAAKKWNELPDNVKKATSTNNFKNTYDAWKAGELEEHLRKNAVENDATSRNESQEQ